MKGGTWQSSCLVDGGRWALLGTTMALGFSYDDYESGTSDLVDHYSSQQALIVALLVDGGRPET